jgi:ACT domain-containing protein
MNKYEIQMLLQNFGFDRDLQGLYLDVVYSYYDLVFDELKLFVDDPRGLQIGVEFKDGLNASIMEKIEENPMLIFTILNNMELNLSANPRI